MLCLQTRKLPRAHRFLTLAAMLAGCSWATQAGAQATPSLVTALNTLTAQGVFQYDALEFDSAAANDRAYGNLLSICSPQPATGACAPGTNTQRIFQRLRELEDNADQFLGRGETTYSLRLAPEGLGSALRWTAPEEFSAQGALATRFANSQSSVLGNRLAALRIATQALLARDGSSDGDTGGDTRLADADYGAFGGSAGGDSGGFSFGRLSVFVNGGFGTGVKAPTTFEDAFSFDGTEASAGIDYRLSRNFVVGLLVGHTERRVDFNSELSIVDGKLRGNGQGGTLYGQFETDTVYVNASVGLQHMSLHTIRSITYPSNNPDIPSVDETSTSDTGSNTLTGTVAAGYVLHYRGFSAEPYLNAEYVHVRINSFTEHSGNGFDFEVGEQTIHSSTGAAGLKLQYALLPPFGVIVPYVYAEYRKIFSDPSRTLDSTYAAGDSSATTGVPDMQIPTDAAPSYYYVFGGGGSVVLKHGLQGFMQYVRIQHYTNYTDHVVSGGVRWEF